MTGPCEANPPTRGFLTFSALIYYNVYNKNGPSLICWWKHQILQKCWRLSLKLRCVASQWPVIFSNIIILLWINYTIKMVMCINNAIITNNYGKPKDLFSSSKFKRALERISSKSVNNSGTHPQKSAPALVYGFYFLGFYLMSVSLSLLINYFCKKLSATQCRLLHHVFVSVHRTLNVTVGWGNFRERVRYVTLRGARGWSALGDE